MDAESVKDEVSWTLHNRGDVVIRGAFTPPDGFDIMRHSAQDCLAYIDSSGRLVIEVTMRPPPPMV